MQNSEIILVTGAAGYLGSHCVKILLEQGRKVRASVRSIANKTKYEYLYSLVPEKFHANLSFVEADLVDANSWDAACEGVTYVLHVASPIPPYVPKHEDEVIKPAVEGTVNVLNAAIKKGVKKLVLTSSCLALFFGNEDKVMTEDMWSDPNKCFHYPKSKVLAEKAGWDIYEKNKDKIEFCVVCPSLVLGPEFKEAGNSSEGMMKEIMKGTMPGIPNPDCGYAVVDVRDSAEAHVKALFGNTNGQRYINAGHNINMEGIVEILDKEFGQYGYQFAKKKVSADEIKASGNGVAMRSLMLMGKTMKFNNGKGVKELGLTYRGIEDTLKDMAWSLIKVGVIEDKTKK